MNYQRYLLLLLRYSWLIILITAVTMTATWIWLGKQKPVYASRATLEVESQAAKVVDIQDVKETRVSGLDEINTVVQNLISNSLMLDVAARIGRTAEWAATNPSGQITPSEEGYLAGSVRGQITVSLRRGTRLIDIVAEENDPEKARVLANAVVDAFLESLSGDRLRVSKDANTFLLEEAQKLKAKLEESEQKVAKYRQETNAVSLDKNQNLVAERLGALNTQVTETNSLRAKLESDLKAMENVPADDLEAMLNLTSVASLPQVGAARAALSSKEAEFAALQERYLEQHPKYIAAKGELDDLRAKLKDAVREAGDIMRQQFQTFSVTEAKLKEMLAEQEKKSLELERMAIPYNVLQREAQSDRELYEAILTRLKETEVTQGLTKTPYRVVEEPLVNAKPVRPNPPKTLLTACLLALAAGVGLVLLLDQLDSSIRTVDEAEGELELPVLAAIPELDASKMPEVGSAVIVDMPASSQAEAFRTLRASISLLGEETNRRLMLMTSAIPSEGKTFSSLNLAAALASQGFRVLLIDADLRRPALTSSMLKVDQRKEEGYRGLSDVLSGLEQPVAVIRSTAIENLWLLPAGRRAPNPAELLAQPIVGELLTELSKSYDRVIVDSAPINAVSDTLALANKVHQVILVLRFGKTPRRAIQRALKLLDNAGAKMGGLVMNRMPSRRGSAYYYYYYGDEYEKDSVYGGSDPLAGGKNKRNRRKKTTIPAATRGSEGVKAES